MIKKFIATLLACSICILLSSCDNTDVLEDTTEYSIEDASESTIGNSTENEDESATGNSTENEDESTSDNSTEDEDENTNSSSTTIDEWRIGYYVDEFKTATDEKYIYCLIVDGMFSNSATTNSELAATIQVDEDYLGIKLFTYGKIDNVVKNSSSSYSDDYSLKVKLPDESIIELSGKMYAGGSSIALKDSTRDKFISALSSEPVGETDYIMVYIEEDDRPTTNYLISIPLSNFSDIFNENFGTQIA